MFFVDKPYVSEFVKNTLKENSLPVVGTTVAKSLELKDGTLFLSEDEAVAKARSWKDPILYATSENCIDWIAKNLSFTGIPAKIELFKNKIKFREMTRPLFPEFYFRAINADDLETVCFDELPLPFIIKPSVGFFSMGVHKVANHEQWTTAVVAIRAEIERTRGLYPQEVLDSRSFIVEECIDGEEFAVDAYYDSAGDPVVLGIFKHVFSSGYDVSDRVYITSKGIIESNLGEFTDILYKIGEVAGGEEFSRACRGQTHRNGPDSAHRSESYAFRRLVYYRGSDLSRLWPQSLSLLFLSAKARLASSSRREGRQAVRHCRAGQWVRHRSEGYSVVRLRQAAGPI